MIYHKPTLTRLPMTYAYSGSRGTKTFRICWDCIRSGIPAHAENCGTCFGWGLDVDDIPIAAGEVGTWAVDFQPCPECGCSIRGLPALYQGNAYKFGGFLSSSFSKFGKI